MSRLDDLRAELALAELEAEMVAAKLDPDVSDEATRALKLEVRAARKAVREAREAL